MEPVETVVARLLKNLTGKTVTHEDIFELAADASTNTSYLGRILKALKKEGIKVLDFPTTGKKTGKEDDQSAAIRKLGDPIRMYFSQMSGISLLTREQEVEYAKEIEASRINLRRELYATRHGQQRVIELFQLIMSKEIMIEKALDVNLSQKGERAKFFKRLEKSLAALERNLKANVKDFETLKKTIAGLNFPTAGAKANKTKTTKISKGQSKKSEVARIQKRLLQRIRRTVGIIEEYHIKLSYLARWKSALVQFGEIIHRVLPNPAPLA